MKRFGFICLAIICFLQLQAQENKGVHFEDLTYAEALQKAKDEGKLVFLDCYTSWCGPCKYVANEVFPLPVMGEYFNKTFVNIKFDMEKGEGITLRRKFHINSYPTFLIIRPDGTVQHRIAGSRPAEKFLACAKRGANEKTSLCYLSQLHQENKLTEAQQADYRTALKDAGDHTTLFLLTKREFNQLPDEQRCDAGRWYLYEEPEVGPSEERFAYIIDHKATFDKNVGKEVVDKKLYESYLSELSTLKVSSVKRDISQQLNTIKEQLSNVDFEGKQQIDIIYTYVEAFKDKNIDALLTQLEEHLNDLPDGFLYDVPFLSFIIEGKDKTQIERYLALENPLAEHFSDNPNMQKIIREAFAKYR